MTVERVRVGDVLRLERREVTVDPVKEYRLIGVYSFGKGILHRDPKVGAELGDYRYFEIHPGDLVLSNIQAWEGAIALATEADVGTVGTHRFLTYTSPDGRIDTDWARWFFLSEPGMDLIRQAAPGTTMRNRTLAIQRFEELEIPLPPIDDQRRVASELDAMQRLTDRVSTALSAGGAETAVSTLPILTDSVINSRAADAVPISDLAEFVSDVVHPGDDPSPADSFVGLQHIERHTGRRLGSDPLDGLKGRKFRFRPGDVVYGYLRPYLNKVWLADRHGLCSVDQYVLRPRAAADAELLSFVLRGQGVLSSVIYLTHSLQLPRLRSGLLSSLVIPVVDSAQVEEVVERLLLVRSRVIQAAGLREHQLELASAILPSALNQAFAGLS